MNKQHAQNKPTQTLSADLFLKTALQLAEESGGLQKLSLRQLGKAMDVDPTAVYRYFRSKDELVAAMAERIVYDLLPTDEELAGDWRVRVTALAHHARRVFTAYPLLSIDLPSSPYIQSPAGDQLLEIGYQALTEAGLSDDYVVYFHELLYTFTMGMSQLDAQLGVNFEAERALIRDHATKLPAVDFPNLNRLAPLVFADSDIVFQLGLDIYLNAIESYANGSTGQSSASEDHPE